MTCPHDWDLSPEEAIATQRRLARRIRLQPLPVAFQVLGASDIGYVPSLNQLVAVIVTFSWPDLVQREVSHVVSPIRFPYIPGLLSFREVPPLMDAYRQLQEPPGVLLCDGQGIAHPRRLGLASHLGLCLDIPTVGCAKKRLTGKHEPLDSRRGHYTPLTSRGEVIGFVFRSRDNVKPLYISPGHLADLESSRQLIEGCLGRYRLPEPLRQAHNLATQFRQQLARP